MESTKKKPHNCDHYTSLPMKMSAFFLSPTSMKVMLIEMQRYFFSRHFRDEDDEQTWPATTQQ